MVDASTPGYVHFTVYTHVRIYRRARIQRTDRHVHGCFWDRWHHIYENTHARMQHTLFLDLWLHNIYSQQQSVVTSARVCWYVVVRLRGEGVNLWFAVVFVCVDTDLSRLLFFFFTRIPILSNACSLLLCT